MDSTQSSHISMTVPIELLDSRLTQRKWPKKPWERRITDEVGPSGCALLALLQIHAPFEIIPPTLAYVLGQVVT